MKAQDLTLEEWLEQQRQYFSPPSSIEEDEDEQGDQPPFDPRCIEKFSASLLRKAGEERG